MDTRPRLAAASRLLLFVFSLAACCVALLSCGTIEPATIVDPMRALLEALVRDGTLSQMQADILGRLLEQLVAQVFA